MTWLLFLYAFTLGAEQTDMVWNNTMQWYGYSEFEASVLMFNTLELGGASAVYFRPDVLPWFDPIEGDFRVFGRLRFGILALEAEHLCIHTFGGVGMYSRNRQGYNRLTLTLSNRGDR